MNDRLRIAVMAMAGLFCCVIAACAVAFGYYLSGLDFNERCPKLAECYGTCVTAGVVVGAAGFCISGLLGSFLK